MDTNLPFFDDSHAKLARDLDAWCKANLHEHDDQDTDATCKALVKQLGDAGWLSYCVPASYGGVRAEIDSRSLCILRETLAYYNGLADFSFAMQGLGSGAITLFGSEA